MTMQRKADSGFTLIEATVVLLLLALTMTLAMGLYAMQARVLKRLQAQEEAWNAIETTLESLRARALPLTSMQLADFEVVYGPGAAQQMAIDIAVEAGDVPDLLEVTITADYQVLGVAQQRRVETLVWNR